MTTDPNYDPNFRPPLKLPPGSIRSTLSLLIGGMFWLLVLFSEQSAKIPLHLYFLLALLLLFVSSRGKSYAQKESDAPGPFWLPGWFFPILIGLGFVGTIGWKWFENPDQLKSFLTPTAEQLKLWPYLLVSVAGGFILGRLLAAGPWQRYPMFRDIQGWVAIIAILALGAEIIILVFIKPTLSTQELNLPMWECILTGIVAAYFGIRS